MKKFLLSICIMVIFALSGCEEMPVRQGNDKRVLNALTELKTVWNEMIDDYGVEDSDLEVIYTRIINIKAEADDDIFNNMAYFVEFVLLTDLYESNYKGINSSWNNCVCVYNDGTMNVSQNPLDRYRTRAYSNDFSDIVESVEDFDIQYNQSIDLDK